MGEFKAISKGVRVQVDVLVQLFEVYCFMAKLLPDRVEVPGGRSFELLWRAAGFELAARIFRLLEVKGSGRHNFVAVSNLLADDVLLDELFVASGRRSRAEFARTRDTLLAKLSGLQASIQYRRIEVFRHRFVGHRLPSPGILLSLPPEADVENLKLADLRYVISRVCALCRGVAALESYKHFRPKAIAEVARYDAKELWNPVPNPIRSILKR